MRVVDAVRIELRFQTDTAAGAVENAVLTRDIQVISAVQLKSGPVGDDRQLPSGSGIAQNGGWISGKNKVVVVTPGRRRRSAQRPALGKVQTGAGYIGNFSCRDTGFIGRGILRGVQPKGIYAGSCCGHQGCGQADSE